MSSLLSLLCHIKYRNEKIWKQIFAARYPLSVMWETQSRSVADDNDITYTDWYTLCKQRCLMECALSPVILDIGTHYIRYGALSTEDGPHGVPLSRMTQMMHVLKRLHPHYVAA